MSQPQPNPGQQAGHHSHAPEQGKSALGLMGLISLVLGVVFLIGRTLVAPENMDLATEIEQKRELKQELDRRTLPFRVLAAAWSCGVMLGQAHCGTEGDDAQAACSSEEVRQT